MTTTEFIEIWKKYLELYLTPDFIIKYWDKNSEWTNNFFNKEYLKKIFNNSNIEFEYRKIDMVVYSKEKYININNFDNSGNIKSDYPLCLDLVVEHENNYQNCYEEIRKLTEIKAKLKVLISYPPNDVESKKALCEKMSKGIKQSNFYFPENDRTEYLLIFGYEKPELWEFIGFDTFGNKINYNNKF